MGEWDERLLWIKGLRINESSGKKPLNHLGAENLALRCWQVWPIVAMIEKRP